MLKNLGMEIIGNKGLNRSGFQKYWLPSHNKLNEAKLGEQILKTLRVNSRKSLRRFTKKWQFLVPISHFFQWRSLFYLIVGRISYRFFFKLVQFGSNLKKILRLDLKHISILFCSQFTQFKNIFVLDHVLKFESIKNFIRARNKIF